MSVLEYLGRIFSDQEISPAAVDQLVCGDDQFGVCLAQLSHPHRHGSRTHMPHARQLTIGEEGLKPRTPHRVHPKLQDSLETPGLDRARTLGLLVRLPAPLRIKHPAVVVNTREASSSASNNTCRGPPCRAPRARWRDWPWWRSSHSNPRGKMMARQRRSYCRPRRRCSRAATACRAISRRRAGVRRSARAFPPSAPQRAKRARIAASRSVRAYPGRLLTASSQRMSSRRTSYPLSPCPRQGS